MVDKSSDKWHSRFFCKSNLHFEKFVFFFKELIVSLNVWFVNF